VEFVEAAPGTPRLGEIYPVMHELRTELSEQRFNELYAEGYPFGYRVVGLFDDSECRAAAGYHVTHGFANGRFIYVDDLITAEAHRSKGYGKALTDYLIDRARAQGCEGIQLDSGTWRHDAPRFYFREGYVITAFHFSQNLND
jgi:GNAT superfamily N-acetyltransferase